MMASTSYRRAYAWGDLASRDRRHGDPFPLPCSVQSLRAATLGTAGTGGTLTHASSTRLRQGYGQVRAVNHLAASSTKSRMSLGASHPPQTSPSPTAAQSWMLSSINRRVVDYGPCPTDLTAGNSLAELLSSQDLYSQEPKHLASYDLSKIKVTKRLLKPRDARSVLPPSVAALLSNSSVCIEKDAAEMQDTKSALVPKQPYWDPILKGSRSKRLEFFRVLYDKGMLGLRRQIKNRVGFFMVKKKDGNQRVITDARLVNACHRPPPVTRLGSSGAMVELDFSEAGLRHQGFVGLCEMQLAGAEGDVGDCHFNFLIEDLASWFGVAEEFTVGDLRQSGFDIFDIYDEDSRTKTLANATDTVFFCVRVISMGWSWSLCVCEQNAEV